MVAAQHPFDRYAAAEARHDTTPSRRRRRWHTLASQTRRGVRGGAVLGAIAPAVTMAMGHSDMFGVTALVVPLAAVIGGWALAPR